MEQYLKNTNHTSVTRLCEEPRKLSGRRGSCHGQLTPPSQYPAPKQQYEAAGYNFKTMIRSSCRQVLYQLNVHLIHIICNFVYANLCRYRD